MSRIWQIKRLPEKHKNIRARCVVDRLYSFIWFGVFGHFLVYFVNIPIASYESWALVRNSRQIILTLQHPPDFTTYQKVFHIL